MSAPFFSIIIPTYNRACLITNTLYSCLKQEFAGAYEILVVDDGGTDNTADIVAQINNTKIKYYKISNRERGAARNYGTNKSEGKYITFLDSDDILHINHLSNAFELIQNRNSPDIFHLGYQIEDVHGKILHKYNSPPYQNLNRALLEGNYLSCMGVFLKRVVAHNFPFSEIRELSGTEDWLLWLKLAARYQIEFSTKISASLIDHEQRSIRHFNIEELKTRTSILIEQLKGDKQFISQFGYKSVQKIHAHMLTYSALHLILSNHKKEGWKQFLKGIRLNTGEFFNRRTLAIIKHSL